MCCDVCRYCGTGRVYCQAPDCQINYGPACDGNQKPSGFDTSTVARPKVNNGIPYGGLGIYDCVTKGEVAITYDDGPYLNTADVLDKFKVCSL
jgi:hypothetical protein